MSADFQIAHNAGCKLRGVLAAAVAAVLAGACSSSGELGGLELPQLSSSPPAENITEAPKSELDKALVYWSEEHKKKPHDLKAALSYARNLKAAGHKQDAFSVLQGASLLHGDSTELASEYGRLALEFGQVQVAQKLLVMADDPVKPDWRVVSARGTVMAKQGMYAEAIPFYERALAISPNQSSVLNNLALAYAADGQSVKAEQILRTAADKGGDVKIKQNLALVLGLQGKHDEARLLSATQVSAETASADSDYLKRMVKAPQAPGAAPIAAMAVAAPKRAPAKSPAVIQAKTNGTGKADAFRPTEDTNAVASPAGAWSTTVSLKR